MKSRPTRYDDAIITTAATAIAKRMQEQWLYDGEDVSDIVSEISSELVSEISKVIRYETDGYAIARALDDYNPDAALVKMLNLAVGDLAEALHAACKAWVIETGIVAPAIDSRVRYITNTEVGVVTHNYSDGSSRVCFESLGYTLKNRINGLVIYWELLTPCEIGI